MSAREVVRELTGPQLAAVKRAHESARMAQAILQEVAVNANVARAHLSDMLVGVTGEDADGLLFDPERGTIYREVGE
jgi:hypothetical protein